MQGWPKNRIDGYKSRLFSKARAVNCSPAFWFSTSQRY
uniref:Uncharacterized protein n=1 Tax=Podoviridae sp. cthVG1 TaxID=2827297 RepID=A0A8S5R9M1_9CAUD|nr:MAG TPA: hypothetical protein [Podoviridae sp. cthVG1]